MSMARRALVALLDFGPMTRAQLAEHLEVSRDSLSGLSQLMRKTPTHEKLIHIKDWVREGDSGAKMHLRPLYAIGNHADKVKPPPVPNSEVHYRYERRYLKSLQVSIFDMGLTINRMREIRKQRNALANKSGLKNDLTHSVE